MKITWILIALILFVFFLSFATEHDIIKAAKAGDVKVVQLTFLHATSWAPDG
jgi:hypothetical protein